MKREALEQILKDRQIKGAGGVFDIPENESATLVVGEDRVSTIGGIAKLTLKANFIKVKSKKGVETYLEYDLVRAVSFEPKEVTDRTAGFV